MLKALKDFSPWILYFILVGHNAETAVITACVAFLAFSARSLFKGFILSWGTLIFFLFMLIYVALLKNQWVGLHGGIFSNFTLAAIAWVSLLAKKPFTGSVLNVLLSIIKPVLLEEIFVNIKTNNCVMH